jgi:hypothetical protein
MNVDEALQLLESDPVRAVRELEQDRDSLSQLRISRDEALQLLTSGEGGIREWNIRRSKIEIIESLFLQEKDKDGVTFMNPAFKYVDLTNVDLPEVQLRDANLVEVNFRGSTLRDANFSYIDLSRSDFEGADLQRGRFFNTNLGSARLRRANLGGAHFSGTNLGLADFYEASCWDTVFANVDLSESLSNNIGGPINLHAVRHLGPSEISTSSLVRSKGAIPAEFLRGCGVPETFIELMPSLISNNHMEQFYSCFISYSHEDEDFAAQLYGKLREERLRVWFAPEHMKGGQKIFEQIDRAIRAFDKVLLILSEASMRSEWVITEIRKARRVEQLMNRRVLFPISVVPFDSIQNWECFDADSGKDLGVEVREYFINDFSEWNVRDAFEMASSRLIRDLRRAD